MIRRFLSFTDITSRAAEALAVLLLFAFCLLMLAEVFSRGFLATSLPFSWEYAAFAMGGTFLLGLGPALRHGTQVRVSLVLDRGGPRWRRGLDLAATAAALGLGVLVFLALFSVFQTSLARGLRAASYMATPLAVPQFIALLGAGQFVLALAARLLRLMLGEPTELPRPDEDLPHA
ncbi:TRAP transporter small permease (plasmid) [Paroceanicella profunda]|uniref:TRAP transporter small permease protein n=1 Tax=Paroceanicella profunda TaxID=2579971 RepID=A0A5B8G4C0_9RHOB|nr:TRAP transporter small permease [Paroceanicella profunda]QDL94924.1 TRAP transporter small permease [Paroceanicella profunda]